MELASSALMMRIKVVLINGIWSPLLRVKIVHLVDMSDLFKISNLVYDGREIVKSQYCSLQGQRVLWRV